VTATPEADAHEESARTHDDAATPAEPTDSHIDDEGEAPVSEDDALKALRDGSGEDTEEAEAARAAMIATRVVSRLQRDPSGARIGSVALFNGAVSFGGGLGMGDGPSSGRADAGLIRVEGEELAQYTEFYCQPAVYSEAFGQLSDNRLIVLVGSAGSGREAAAWNLLAEALASSPDDSGCYRVVNDPRVVDSTWTPPKKHSGYVIMLDDLPNDVITERWFSDITTRVRTAHSFLVLVCEQARAGQVRAAARSSGLVIQLDAVDPIWIVQRRVLGHEPDPTELAELDERLRSHGVTALLGEQRQPHIAVRIAEVIRTGGDLAVEVRTLRDPTSQVHQWFGSHEDKETRCFSLAAAALEDASYLTVSDAAMDLHGILEPMSTSSVDIKFRERLGSNHAWLEVSILSEPDDGVALEVPRVRFRDPLVQQAVLGYAWSYLDGYRPAMLNWLRRLVEHRNVEVRARTSVAAGVIAWSDYEYAMDRYIRSWAGHQRKSMRQAAATALDVAGAHPDITEPVWSVLEAWAPGSGTPFSKRLSLTAAMVAGGLMGYNQPTRAMAVLRTVLDRLDWAPLVTVGHSVLRLVELDRVDEVLTGLLAWSSPQDSSPFVTKTLSVFTFVMCQPAPDGGTPVLFAQAPKWRTRLVELWARALARKPAQIQALKALRDCLDRYGETDTTVMTELRQILIGVADYPGEHRRRLEWYLHDWANDRNRPSAAAARLRAEINRAM
jgi:hypothetical protein